MSASSLRVITAALLLPLVALFASGCDTVDTDDGAEVVVMSYNLYLGADIFEITQAPPQQVPLIAGQLWADVQATDFPTRAQAIASITAQHNPALIGIQEATLYRSLTPSQFGAVPADHVEYDFLEILMDALAGAGLNYRIVTVVENADVQVPATQDGGQTFFDIRLTDRGAILARNDVSTSGPVNGNYQVAASVEVGGETVEFTRGYNYVSATVEGVSFTFANTHLEVQVAAPQQPQEFQALELLQVLQNQPQPIVLVGDFNSPADGSGTATYELVTALYADAVAEVGPQEPTCCQAPLLDNPQSELTTRIDLILHRGEVTTVSTATVGNRPEDKINGLWPSDHAGVVARLRVAN